MTFSFIAVLEEFLDYVVKLDFDTEPDYDKCRKMFKTALTKAKFPLDGKIDFTTPKNAPKKVRKSSPRKRKISYSTAESADSDAESDAEVEITKKASGGKKKNPAVKRAIMKDQGCQTSPGFVAAAKAARQKSKRSKTTTTGENPEMDKFAKKAMSAAKKATAAKKSVSPKKATKKESENNGDLSNPTPAMLALMAKKAEKPSPKKRSISARK